MRKTEDLLAEREKTHGSIVETLKRAGDAMNALQADDLEPTLHMAISQILLKLARITNGDPYFADHWEDVAGYATGAYQYVECHKK